MSASIVSCCDAPPILQLGEHVLDLVALTVERLVVGDGCFAASGRGNAGLDAHLDQGFSKPIAVITFIAGQCHGFGKRRQHSSCAFMIAGLAWREVQNQWLTVLIGHGMQFGIQPALRAANTAGNIPFFKRLAAVR